MTQAEKDKKIEELKAELAKVEAEEVSEQKALDKHFVLIQN